MLGAILVSTLIIGSRVVFTFYLLIFLFFFFKNQFELLTRVRLVIWFTGSASAEALNGRILTSYVFFK